MIAALLCMLAAGDDAPVLASRTLVPDLERAPRIVASSRHVAWIRSQRRSPHDRIPTQAVWRQSLEGGPPEALPTGRLLGGYHLALDDQGTVAVALVGHGVDRIDVHGTRETLRLPGWDGGVRQELLALYTDGAVVWLKDEGRLAWIPFDGPRGLMACVLDDAEPRPRPCGLFFVRDGARLCWSTEGNEPQVVVADVERGEELYRGPVPDPDGFVVDGLYGDVVLAHSGSTWASVNRAHFIEVDTAATTTLLVRGGVGHVLPEGILGNGWFHDPVSGLRSRVDEGWTGDYRVRRAGRELWLLPGGSSTFGKAPVLSLDESLPSPPERIDPFEAALDSDDVNVWRKGLLNLGHDGGERAVRLLVEALHARDDPWVKTDVAVQLARTGDPRVVDVLLAPDVEPWLGDCDRASELVLQLGVLGDPRTTPLIERMRPRANEQVDAALASIVARPRALRLMARLR